MLRWCDKLCVYVQALVKIKEAGKVYQLSSLLKRLGCSIARKNRSLVSLQVIKNAAMRKRVLVILQKDLQKELESICSLYHNSVLRSASHTLWKKEVIVCYYLLLIHAQSSTGVESPDDDERQIIQASVSKNGIDTLYENRAS